MHSDNFKCDLCDKRFWSERTLQRHNPYCDLHNSTAASTTTTTTTTTTTPTTTEATMNFNLDSVIDKYHTNEKAVMDELEWKLQLREICNVYGVDSVNDDNDIPYFGEFLFSDINNVVLQPLEGEFLFLNISESITLFVRRRVILFLFFISSL